MRITTLRRLFKFQKGKLGTALLTVTALFFLIPTLALAQNSPPIVEAGPNQTIYLNDAVTLHGTAIDPDGDPIMDWQWEVISAPGVGTYSLADAHSADALFTANTVGNYVITLIAMDGLAWSDPDAVVVMVVENLPPVAVPSASPTSGPAPLTVTFDGSESYDPEGETLYYDWIFDDGETGTGANPTHTYDSQGIYQVVLGVTDDHGNDDFDIIEITVCGGSINCPPVADAGEDQTIFVSQSTLLDGRGSFDPDVGDTIEAWEWAVESQPPGSTPYFPDTITSQPVFSGNLPGDYVISLQVSDGTDWSEPDTVTITVVENMPPVAVAAADVTSGPAPLTVQLDGTGSSDPEGGELLYRWRFTDGTPDEWTALVEHEFTSPGTYTAILTVEDDRGQQDSDSIVITVTEPGPNLPPVASADGPISGIEGMPCTMDASDSSDPEGAPLSYSWNFGDGSTMETTEATIEHTYRNAGTYFVTLVVNDGELDSGPLTIEANIGFRGGQRSDVDSFLFFLSPDEKKVDLPAGTTSYDVKIVYGGTIDEGTFEATLNKQPFGGFTPVAGSSETVTVPLSSGRNVLKVQVEGTRNDGRFATDKDTLTFIVP